MDIGGVTVAFDTAGILQFGGLAVTAMLVAWPIYNFFTMARKSRG